MALNLGGVIRLTYTVKDDTGALTNPSTRVLTIIQPDGTTATPTITNPSTGLLRADFTPAQAGLHSVHWVTTGPTTAEDDVFVAERPASLLISVDEAVEQLSAAGVITSDADRETLQQLCLDASEAIERDLGRALVRRTVVETYDGVLGAIVLRSSPVSSITSVSESGTSLTSTDYSLDSRGMLRRGQYGTSTWDTSRYQNIVVTYVVGFADPPRVARRVARLLVQSLWQESQQASHPLLDESAALAGEALPGALAGLHPTLRDSYSKLRRHGVA